MKLQRFKRTLTLLHTGNDQVHRVITGRDAVGLKHHFGFLMVNMRCTEDMVQKLVQLQAAEIMISRQFRTTPGIVDICSAVDL